MAGRRVDVFGHVNESIDITLYNDDLRKMFGLPHRLGKFTEVSLVDNTLKFKFVVNRSRHQNLTIKETKRG